VKKLSVVHFVLTVFLCVTPINAQDNVIDEIVWVVGDEPILRSEVETQRLQSQLDGVKFDGDPYCIIPEQLAIQKLYVHQADLDSITVNESDIVSMVDKQINRSITYMGSKEKLEEAAKMPIPRLREWYRENYRVQSLMNQVQNKLVGDVKVTPAEIREYYNSIPKDSLPTIPGEVEVEIITIEPKYAQQDIDAIKDKLRDFTERINKGESFATLAIMYSEDKGSARVGGELGFIGKAMLDPDFANVAFSLTDPKKVSKIVESEYGFHIIQLIEKMGDRINCRHILLKPKINVQERNKALQKLDSIAKQISSSKLGFTEAAKLYSSDKETRNNGGLMVNPATMTPRFKLEALPQDMNNVVYNLRVGEVSEPFTLRMEQNKDKEICAIVRLKSKTTAHKASLTEDFQTLKQLVLEKKRTNIIDNWIKEKQAKIYIRISENWRSCTFKYPGWIK
jgi:peptidyl-prolyl cis-trans isomerase SurA